MDDAIAHFAWWEGVEEVVVGGICVADCFCLDPPEVVSEVEDDESVSSLVKLLPFGEALVGQFDSCEVWYSSIENDSGDICLPPHRDFPFPNVQGHSHHPVVNLSASLGFKSEVNEAMTLTPPILMQGTRAHRFEGGIIPKFPLNQAPTAKCPKMK